MKRFVVPAVVLIAFDPLWAQAGPIQTSLDLAFGIAVTESDRLKGVDPSTSMRTSAVEDYSPSLSWGLRGTAWFTPWLGIGGDLSAFHINGDDFVENNSVLAFTPLVMFSVPVGASPQYPLGRVQPYVGIGPGFFLSFFDGKSIEPSGEESSIDDLNLDVGLDARLGIAIPVQPKFALFVEYRYTYFDSRYEDDAAIIFPSDDRVEADFGTHHILFGVSFRL